MLNKRLLSLLFFFAFSVGAQELCLYDANDDGEFAGSTEIRECETWSTFGGTLVNSCPIGRVACNIEFGIPVCPTDPSYPCTQPDAETPLSCSAVPPQPSNPPELGIEYDYDDNAYIISTPSVDREACVRPIIETCLAPVPVDCSLYPDPAFCPNPDSCLQTETWNPITQVYDVTVDCTPSDPCYEDLDDCTMVPVIDPITGLPVVDPISGEIVEEEVCTIVCPATPTCEIDPATLEGANVCPLDETTPCTSSTKGSDATACSPTPEVIPPPCHLEYDQDGDAFIICDQRRANCQLDGGEYQCPFNSSSSACKAPEGSTNYKCEVDEVVCKTSAGNTTTAPVPFEPYPASPSADEMPTENECMGQIRIFHGEPFSCNLAGVRSRWDNCCNNGNEIINDAMGNYWDGITNMAEGIAGINGSEFLIDAITLYFYGLPAYHLTEALTQVANWLLTPCADDSYTAAMIANGRCKTVGVKCVESLFGTCLQEKQIECCFASKLSRIIQEQGRPQLDIGWGTVDSPNCEGLTPEQFQSIDFSQIDLTEYIDDMEVRAQSEIDTQINDSVADDLLDITGG